uniref:Uncharacterized protein n=1 Tax=Mesocestoides corti TaxID=53468 RepID=A0A5K3FGK9_MESCO
MERLALHRKTEHWLVVISRPFLMRLTSGTGKSTHTTIIEIGARAFAKDISRWCGQRLQNLVAQCKGATTSRLICGSPFTMWFAFIHQWEATFHDGLTKLE